MQPRLTRNSSGAWISWLLIANLACSTAGLLFYLYTANKRNIAYSWFPFVSCFLLVDSVIKKQYNLITLEMKLLELSNIFSLENIQVEWSALLSLRLDRGIFSQELNGRKKDLCSRTQNFGLDTYCYSCCWFIFDYLAVDAIALSLIWIFDSSDSWSLPMG